MGWFTRSLFVLVLIAAACDDGERRRYGPTTPTVTPAATSTPASPSVPPPGALPDRHLRPGIATLGARDVTEAGATFRAYVNPSGEATTYYFDYGTFAGFKTTRTFDMGSTSQMSAGNGVTSLFVTAGVTGLKPATAYIYRVVAVNATGTATGGNETFSTMK
jgi:hypothetical protein